MEGADPVGARLVRGREKEEVLEIVGVAADTKTRTLGEAAASSAGSAQAEGGGSR